MRSPLPLLLATLLLPLLPASAAVRLAQVFGDHMVLQREMPVPIWGWAEPGEAVTVSFAGASAAATAGKDGKWMAKLPPMKASAEGRELVVAGKDTLTLKDVVVGEVWLCGGQSNMESEMGWCSPEDARTASLPLFRIVKAEHTLASAPREDVQTRRWMVCEPGRAAAICGTGFYFARKLTQELKIPVGLLDTSWGGANITFWIPGASYQSMPALRPQWEKETAKAQEMTREYLGKIEAWTAQARKELATGGVIPERPPNMPERREFAHMYNGMVHPFAPYAIRGILWYQGEYNANDGDYYVDEMQGLAQGWRAVWGQGEVPFYFVQLPNFNAPTNDPAGGNGWSMIRSVQAKAMKAIANSGMVVTIDVGEANDIHPRNKLDVGERLARWALAKNYGRSDVVFSSPFYKEMKLEGSRIRILFEPSNSPLMVGKKQGRAPAVEDKAGKLQRFAIAGEDRKWVWADAVIDGATVLVSSPQVPNPVAVRYAYADNPEGCNLYNQAGLPASPFRTDSW